MAAPLNTTTQEPQLRHLTNALVGCLSAALGLTCWFLAPHPAALIAGAVGATLGVWVLWPTRKGGVS